MVYVDFYHCDTVANAENVDKYEDGAIIFCEEDKTIRMKRNGVISAYDAGATPAEPLAWKEIVTPAEDEEESH